MSLHYSLESAVIQEQSREPYRTELAYFTDVIFSRLGLPKEPKVLDLGSGLGALGKAMPHDGGIYRIGSDHNVDIAVAGATYYDTYVAADTAQLPFASESLDVVSGFDILNWVPDLDKTISETARVLKLGGTAVFFQCAESGINFLTNQNKVALPVVYESGNLHVFETTKATFLEAWNQVKTILEGTSELANLIANLDNTMLNTPNQLFHVLLSNTEQMSEIENFILRDICRAIHACASDIATKKQEEITVFNRSTNWQRFTDHLQGTATVGGLMFEYGIFELGTHLPKPLRPTAYLLQKTRSSIR